MKIYELVDKRPAEEKAIEAALAALHRRALSKKDKEHIEGYAFDIARAFNIGIGARELARLYKERYPT